MFYVNVETEDGRLVTSHVALSSNEATSIRNHLSTSDSVRNVFITHGDNDMYADVSKAIDDLINNNS